MNRFSVVTAPFPYVDAPQVKRRPCLVIGIPGAENNLLWVSMITSTISTPWPHDVPIKGEDIDRAGLRTDCVVRLAKVATIEAREVKQIGWLEGDIVGTIKAELDVILQIGP